MPEFKRFPKIPRAERVFKSMTITEKLDGTNACVVGYECDGYPSSEPECLAVVDGLELYAQSRKRTLTLDTDNYGFARWVQDHAEELAQLGPGYHFGEWWGNGIQRGYELDEKRFSLFNVSLSSEDLPDCVSLVPVLTRCRFSPMMIAHWLYNIEQKGSYAAPGYMNPEGIMCWVEGIRQYIKAPIDPKPKGE